MPCTESNAQGLWSLGLSCVFVVKGPWILWQLRIYNSPSKRSSFWTNSLSERQLLRARREREDHLIPFGACRAYFYQPRILYSRWANDFTVVTLAVTPPSCPTDPSNNLAFYPERPFSGLPQFADLLKLQIPPLSSCRVATTVAETHRLPALVVPTLLPSMRVADDR